MAEVSPVPEVELPEAERLNRRAKIAGLEAHMKALAPEEHIDLEAATKHYFAGGA